MLNNADVERDSGKVLLAMGMSYKYFFDFTGLHAGLLNLVLSGLAAVKKPDVAPEPQCQ